MGRDLSLWTFAVTAYARPGVEEICLTLQDAYGQNVALLLWRLWALDRPIGPVALDAATAVARTCEGRILAPLRQVRRGLRAPIDGVVDDAREALRESVRRAELGAERLLLDALEAATPPSASGARADPTAALTELAQRWGASATPTLLGRLAAAVGSATG